MNGKGTELQRSRWRALMALALCGWCARRRDRRKSRGISATGSFECRALGGIFIDGPHTELAEAGTNTIALWDVEGRSPELPRRCADLPLTASVLIAFSLTTHAHQAEATISSNFGMWPPASCVLCPGIRGASIRWRFLATDRLSRLRAPIIWSKLWTWLAAAIYLRPLSGHKRCRAGGGLFRR